MIERYRMIFIASIKIAAMLFVGVSIVAYVLDKTGANFYAVDAEQELSKSELMFMSWDGLWHGTDNDTIFTLSQNGTVNIEYCGFDLQRTTGTYKAEGSVITIDAKWDRMYSMQAAADELPQLLLRRKHGALYLFPASAVWAAKYSDFYGWPLRQPRGRNDSQIEKL